MSIEMDQFKDLYVQTALEHLQELSDVLLKLESDHSQLDLVEQLMRAGHSLKGESAAMGFEQMATLGHVIEDLFTGIGNGSLAITDDLANVLFESFDHLRESVESISANGGELSCEDFVTRIKAISGLKTEGFGKSGDAVSHPATEATPAEPVVSSVIQPPITPVVPAVISQPNTIASLSFDPTKLMHGSIGLPPVQTVLQSVAQAVPVEQVPESVATIPSSSTEILPSTPPVISPSSLDDVPMPAPQAGGSVAVAATVSGTSSPPPVPATTDLKKPGVTNEQISSVTIKVDKLDLMIGVSEELVLLKMKLKTNALVQSDAALKSEIHRLDRLVTDLQFYVMQTRLFPISMALHTIPRLVRDVAKKTNKKVRLELEGEETTVDRTIIDHLTEPFVHMIRNAIDHGIESPEMRVAIGKPEEAVVLMKAYTKENKFYVDISDDGSGIDWEKMAEAAIRKGLLTREVVASLVTEADKLRVLFLDGVSTSDEITDISGRGVGMGAVQGAIKKLGGSITVHTEIGRGTTFTIKLPMTLAIMQSLLVGVGSQVFALPANEVSRTILVSPEQVHSSVNREVIVVDDQEVFLHDLAKIFNIEGGERAKNGLRTVVLVRQNDQIIGCIVDQILSEDEILVKPLGPLLKHSQHFSGSTILADGRAAPIINIEGLIWK